MTEAVGVGPRGDDRAGRAEQDGYEGDLISVKNIKTGAILKGRLERGKLVSVMQL